MNNLQSFNLCENWKTKVCTKNDCREDLKSAQRPIAGTWNDTLKHKFISPVFSASPKLSMGKLHGIETEIPLTDVNDQCISQTFERENYGG